MTTSADPAGAILIADGDAPMPNELAKVFQRAGFCTVHAANGQEALELVRKTVGSHIERILIELGVRSNSPFPVRDDPATASPTRLPTRRR